MKSDTDHLLSDHSFKPRKFKSREVSSKYFSDNRVPSPTPNQASSPVRYNARKHQSLEETNSIRGLWPSSVASSSPSHSSSTDDRNLGTLAHHLGNERLRDLLDRKKDDKSSQAFALTRQRSCSDVMKENHRPLGFGGSLRYIGKLPYLSGKSSSFSGTCSNNSGLVPERLSIDENVPSRLKSDSFMDDINGESECSENRAASRKSGIEISSRYLPVRTKKGTNIQESVSLDASPKMKKFTVKNVIKRANSLTNYASVKSQWALSPGRSGSPPMSVESKERLMSFSSLKPPSSPSRASPKGVERFLDIFKAKKVSSPSSLGVSFDIHQLRLLHNRQIQWQFANARANVANANITKQVEKKLSCGRDNLANLQRSVTLKKLQLHKEKLDMKLDFVLHSQMKQIEAWGDMERKHMSAISKTNECLHSLVCRVPLTHAVKFEPRSTCIALRQASDLGASIKSALIRYSPVVEKNAALLSELAKIISQEKLLLQEFLELLQEISMLEIQERSLKCFIIQLNQWQL